MNAFPNPHLAQQWRDRLNRFDDSGLTVAEYCKSEGYSVASFYQWRKRLQQSAADRQAFVAVDVPIDQQDLERPTTIAIELPGGAVVRLDARADQSICRRLIAAVVTATTSHACTKENV